MVSIPSRVRALATIDSYPLDLSLDALADYPAMKLGVRGAVDNYAKALLPMAREAVLAHSEITRWVLTAPLFIRAPAGANLMCWALYPALAAQMPTGCSLTMVDLHVAENRIRIDSAEDFRTCFDYSSNSAAKRAENRHLIHHGEDDILAKAEVFRGRGVLIVNDIRVTGTQQDYMQASFRQVVPAALEWLYLVEVNRTVGMQFPHVEAEINGSKINTFETFAAVINAEGIQHTARCISRLFRHDLQEFKALIRRLSVDKRKSILAVAASEGYYEGEYFKDKYAALKQLANRA